MGRTAMRKVHVREENGRKHTYEAGDEIPDDIAEYITNPGVWIGEGEFVQEETENSLHETDELSKLSIRQLAKLAQDKGVELPPNAKKADLLQALRDAGVTSVG